MQALRLRKARSLIKLLGLAPGNRLPRQQIIELLWSELPAEAAANQLRMMLHEARRALSPDRADTFRYLVSGDPVALVDDAWVDVTGGRWDWIPPPPGRYRVCARASDRGGAQQPMRPPGSLGDGNNAAAHTESEVTA